MQVSDEKCLTAYRAYREAGNYSAGARLLNYTSLMTFKRHCRAAEERGLHLSAGAQKAVQVSNLSAGEAKAGWRVIQHEDGSRDSVYWRAPEKEEEQPEDIAERIADAMNRVLPAPVVQRVVEPSSSIRNFLPVFDFHLSMRTGQYGTAQAVDRLKEGTSEVLGGLSPAEATVILNGGDFTEANDPSFQTPKHKNPLAVDMEYDDTTDIAVEVTAWMIEEARQRSSHVFYKALRGNHDPNTARILRAALAQRYRDDPGVTVDTDGIDFFGHCWEGNFIAGHHGDLSKSPTEYVLGFANRYPREWADSKFRELFTGDKHKLKYVAGDETGMTFNQVRSICPTGRYADENLWSSPSEMIGVSYRAGGGRRNTISHSFWGPTGPIKGAI